MPFYAKFDCGSTPQPDTTNLTGKNIDPNFVISRTADGSTLSTFGMDEWNLKVYGTKYVWNFTTWHQGEKDELFHIIKNEIKTLLWLLMFSPWVMNGGKSTTKAGSYTSHHSLLRSLAKIAYRLHTPLESAHKNAQFQVALKASLASSFEDISIERNASIFGKFLSDTHTLFNHEETSPFTNLLIVPKEELHEWRIRCNKKSHDLARNKKQTPLIPTRILANLIEGCEAHLKAVEPHLDNLIEFINAIYADELLFCDNSQHYDSNVKRLNTIGYAITSNGFRKIKAKIISKDMTISRFNLEAFFAEQDLIPDLKELKAALAITQGIAATLVLAYTGMRKSEALVMPYKCYQEIEIPNFGNAPCVISHTEKFAADNYSNSMLWVAGKPAKLAIEVAQKIAQAFWAMNTNKPFPIKPDNIVPLWLGSLWSTAETKHYDYPISFALFNKNFPSHSKSFKGVTIEQSDIDELVVFDAFRNWDEDSKFEVGKLWPFATHQFRRSVAVYASRSGMVSLPSLSTQYKHLTLTMTQLYAENSGFAEAFIIKDKEVPESHKVITDFRKARQFNSSVAFYEQVVNAESKLSGGRGTEFQIKKDRDTPKFLGSVEDTKKDIEIGRQHFTPLPYGGGCMRKGGTCDAYGIDWTLPCIECKDSIGGGDNGKGLTAYVENLYYNLEDLDEDSMAYKATNETIQRIKVKLLEEGIEI